MLELMNEAWGKKSVQEQKKILFFIQSFIWILNRKLMVLKSFCEIDKSQQLGFLGIMNDLEDLMKELDKGIFKKKNRFSKERKPTKGNINISRMDNEVAMTIQEKNNLAVLERVRRSQEQENYQRMNRKQLE
jgi:hypothetical protein